jgi:hypothetical protein
LESFFEAEKGSTVRCGSLKIVLRERAKNHAIFLVTREMEIVAQMSMKRMLWENPTKTKRLYSILVDCAQPFKQQHEPQSSIIELQNGMKNVNMRVTVTEKPEIVLRHSQNNSNPVSLCVVMVADSSGSISLPLRNEQINAVSIGDEIDLKNAHVNRYQGLLQIVPTRKEGGLIIVKPPKAS